MLYKVASTNIQLYNLFWSKMIVMLKSHSRCFLYQHLYWVICTYVHDVYWLDVYKSNCCGAAVLLIDTEAEKNLYDLYK